MKLFVIKHKKLLISATALLCAAGVLTGTLLHRRKIRRQEAARDEAAWLAAVEQAEQELAAAREALSAALRGTWTRSVEEDRNSRLELSVTGDTMEYIFRNARFPEYDQTLLIYSWEAFDGTSLVLHYPEGGENLIQVTFTPASGDAPVQVTFTPAFTSMDASETWERSEP